MKQSVYALLVSSTAAQTAEPLKKILSRKEILNMEADKDLPLPQFRSDQIDDKCTDVGVQAADTKASGLKSALKLLEDALPALKTDVDAKLKAKKDAVDAVLLKDDAVASKINADDDADFAVLTALRAKNQAQYALDAATLVATAALAAKTAAEVAVNTATQTKADHDASYTEAKAHKILEDGLVATALSDKTSAKTTYDTDNLSTTTKKAAYDLAVTALATATTEEATAKTAYDAAKAISDAYKTDRVDAGTTKKGTSSGVGAIVTSPASEASSLSNAYWTAKKASEDYWTSGAGNTKFGTWNTLGQATENAWIALMTGVTSEDDSKYTGKVDKNACATGTSSGATGLNAATGVNTATCVASCSALKPWDIAAGTVPSTDAYCLGLQIDAAASGTCTGKHTALVTAATGDSGSAGTACYIRTATGLGKAYQIALELSKSGIAAYDDWTDKTKTTMTSYFALIKTEDDAWRPLDIQTQINTKEGTVYTGTHLLDTTTKANAYDKTINTFASDGKKQVTAAKTSDRDSKLGLYNAAKAVSDASKSAYDLKVTAHTTAVAQQALQVKIEALAKLASEKAATDLVALKATLATATTDSSNAETVKTAAQKTLTDATTAHTAKVAEAVTSQTAAKDPLSELVTLRGKAATAWTALDTAEATLKAKKDEIVVKKGEYDAAVAAQIVATRKCKEAKYDSYKRALADRVRTRTKALQTIETLIDDQVAKKPKAGTSGARCEKPTSAGHSKVRGAKVCGDDTLCCGAASGTVGGATMTIEVCQPTAATTYAYQPPRAPLATAFPTKVNWPFACIGGAQHLAAAATAVAGAFYMMA